jgi:hypothetical protein
MPDQVQLHGKNPGEAALVDAWGRLHPLDPKMLLGRCVDGDGLAILEPSVSRHHAQISFRSGIWTIADLGSSNGTYVDDRQIDSATMLHDGDRVRTSHIGFYFLQRGAQLAMPEEPEREPLARGSGKIVSAAFEEERTDPGLPSISLRFDRRPDGDVVVEIEGKPVQLTAPQFELLSVMIRRMASDVGQPSFVRGFVRSAELISGLSWTTREPSENHLKQLVRRVRHALAKVSRGDLIESRQRFGYRLRVVPLLER